MGCWKGPRTKNECQQPPLRVAGVFLRQYGVFCTNEAVLPHLVSRSLKVATWQPSHREAGGGLCWEASPCQAGQIKSQLSFCFNMNILHTIGHLAFCSPL